MYKENKMKTKLILVEGLPGSGKSTTAGMIADILAERNIDAEVFYEGNLDHPADYEGVAYFTEEEFEKLLKESGSLETIFKERIFVKKGRRLLPYMKLKNELGDEFPDELLAQISKHDVYELPLEENIAVISESWEEFAKQAETGDKVYVFECCFIQNPVTVGMIKYGAPADVSAAYVKKLADAVEKLNPLLVYVKQENIGNSFRKAVTERPEEWFNGFVHYYTAQGYGLKNALSGLDGTIEVLKARQELEFAILDQLSMPKVVVDNSRFDLEQHKERLREILK